MSETEDLLYGLMEIADRQQAAVQAALEGLAAERAAWQHEREQLARQVEALDPSVALPQGKCYRAQLIASAKMLPTAGMLFPILQPALERNGHLKLETEIRCKILSMSAATIDRLLRIPRRTTFTRRPPYGASDPSRLAAGNIVGEAAGNRIT
jgi:hypothetical protein